MVGNKKILLATGAAALLGGLATVAATAGEVANYSPVTQERLMNLSRATGCSIGMIIMVRASAR